MMSPRAMRRAGAVRLRSFMSNESIDDGVRLVSRTAGARASKRTRVSSNEALNFADHEVLARNCGPNLLGIGLCASVVKKTWRCLPDRSGLFSAQLLQEAINQGSGGMGQQKIRAGLCGCTHRLEKRRLSIRV